MSEANSGGDDPYDVFVIGGGVNGCGIARDAVGRGLSVALAEMNDLASATSSSSTKLFHGGLRYLEYFEFRLVREALIERERLLSAMPHISWPLRFVLPYSRDIRFESTTPLSRLLALCLPWVKGRRPAWLIRLGLFLYDHLGGRAFLPGTKVLDLRQDESGAPLQDRFRKAFEYSDCWIEDSRLVILNARDARQRGATIMPYTKVVRAERQNGLWHIETRAQQTGVVKAYRARCLINAAGPWVEDILANTTKRKSTDGVRLVRGSHIITRKLYDHDKCYVLQGNDGRIIFVIPYETDFTLIGTTDIDHPDLSTKVCCSPEEREYLLAFASRYFARPLTDDDVVATFSGVRPLHDDGAQQASAATRDYVLRLDQEGNAPLLNVFGGKITTYRKLAEAAMETLRPYFSEMLDQWTAGVALPGGDFAIDGFDKLVDEIHASCPLLSIDVVRRLARAYGTEARNILAPVKSKHDLGIDFGAGIHGVELDWAIENEWVTSAEDFLWRRTRMGLRLTPDQISAVDEYIRQKRR